ncbi:hypothetical protein [Legionella tunisiensis]|uniref:hypothetical protein n=1 Tax=Legionella tunisiensis TaxID=1034944 RepID=UPI0002E0F92E|nr:hypothetical protein [Legionella tunisiensis]
MEEPRQHPVPTNATMKELYANAYSCAFPKCNRPLYKIDDENGVRTLNSNVSHICARSEGGPRWDEIQSQAENRSVNNLLILCLEHAKEIDDPKKVSQYPVEKLREWKEKQLADFDSLGRQGWTLRDEDAEKLSNHFKQVIDLGGKGGSAPGAGGGGGGVLGSYYSKGGDGGKGGDLITLTGVDATAPGAGGGGAGALGDGAIAAGGGEGGELIRKTVNLRNFHHIEFEIGEGGKSGQDGGDTIVKFVSHDNQIIDTLRAKGGRAGAPGFHGDLTGFERVLTKEEFEAGAKNFNNFVSGNNTPL